MTSLWPIPVTPLAPVACGAVLWRQAGVVGVTVVIKATFGLIHEASARMVAPVDIVREDRGRTPGCLDEASELAPYLPGAGILLSGSAHAVGAPAPAVAVRLGVFRERTLLNKVLHVIGDRSREAPGSPRPFASMPIVYERAFGGPAVDDNPVGTGATPGSALPNVVDPQNPHRPAGFGPVARHWGPRRRLLGGVDAPSLERQGAEIPSDFDWAFFHAAPADQQVQALCGDEWIVVDGLHPSLAHLQSRLPSVRAHARWYLSGAAGPGPSRALELRADTLVITPETQLCSVVWRGHLRLEQADAVSRLQVLAGVEMTGYPLAAALQAPDPEVEEMQLPTARIAAAELRLAGLREGLRDGSAPPSGRGAPESQRTGAVMGAAARPSVPAELPRAAVQQAPEPAYDESQDPLNQTERIVTSKLKLPALPFGGESGASGRRTTAVLADTAAAPAPRPRPSLGSTVDAVMSPFASGLPFPVEAPRAPAPGLPFNMSAGAVPLPDDIDDPGSRTSMINVRELEAKAIAPFAISQPGARSDGAAAMIPGAPWSAVPVTKRAFADDDESTVLHQLPVPSTVREAPPAVVQSPPPPAPLPPPRPAAPAPPPSQPALIAAPPPAPVPVTMDEPITLPAQPSVVPRASSRASAEPPPPSSVRPSPNAPSPVPPPAPSQRAPVAPVTELAPAPLTGLRATVVARLAAREPLLDLDLAGADLHDLDLAGAGLTRMDLRGTKLARCKLAGARLVGAQLAEADLTGADLERADLGSADLARALLTGARFDGATLTDASFAEAQGAGASFVAATATRASFARGCWDEARFTRLDGTSADFTAASLAGASFEGATLVESRFDEAFGAGAVFTEARLGRARAVGAKLGGASFRGADLLSSVWERATLDKASFAGADLREANLSRASALEASFVGADLGGANLQRLVGDGADLGEAKLPGADLRQAHLHGASFDGASLRDVLASKADLTGSHFVRADLQGATLRGARLAGVSFAHAQLEGADLRDADLEGANVFGASRKTAKLGAGARGLVELDPGESGPGSR